MDSAQRAAAERTLRSGSRFFWAFVAFTSGLLLLLIAAILDGGDETLIATLIVVILVLAAIVAWLGAGLNRLSRGLHELESNAGG